MIPRLYTIKEAAEQLGLSTQQLYRLVSARRIPYRRISKGAIRFTEADIREYFDACRVAPVAPAAAPPASGVDDEEIDFGFGPVERRYS